MGLGVKIDKFSKLPGRSRTLLYIGARLLIQGLRRGHASQIRSSQGKARTWAAHGSHMRGARCRLLIGPRSSLRLRTWLLLRGSDTRSGTRVGPLVDRTSDARAGDTSRQLASVTHQISDTWRVLSEGDVAEVHVCEISRFLCKNF